MENTLKKSERIVFVVFQSFLLFFPVEFNSIKLVLMALLSCFILLNNRKIEVPGLYVYCIIYVIFNIISIFWGLLNGAPGALRTYTVDVIYPLVLPILYFYYCERGGFWLVAKVIVFGGTLVACYDILYILSELGVAPFFRPLYIDELSLNFATYGLITHFTSAHLNALFFAFPFTMALLFMNGMCEIKIPHNFLIVSVVLQLICVLLATRAALLAVAGLAPVMIAILNLIVHKKLKISLSLRGLKTMLIILGFVLLLILNFGEELLGIWDFLSDKILYEGDPNSDAERALSRDALFEGWLTSPIFGHGTGSYTPLITRSENPWEYEVTYYALLFQKGIVGFIGTFLLYIVIIIKSVELSRRCPELYPAGIALCVAFISFLIANAYDPYLGKLGYMWVVFIPLSFASHKRHRRMRE